MAEKPTTDFSWVKTGKVVWDWYYKWNLENVDFKSGINTETYKYLIDFAAKYEIEYVNIDDGWSTLHNFDNINNKLDLEEILKYAKEKNVGIFLWATWQTLEKNTIEDLDKFEKMGIAGLKVDFFDRCDQKVVDFINFLAEECAKRKLLLNLHGMYKPTGLNVTFPNVVNLEGVLGLEYNKFSDKCTPTHNATIPFVRNTVGPMDYTPGGMRYVDSLNFEKSWAEPKVMTTKAQQLAMYIVYYGGIQMLADSPTLFEKDSIAMSYLSDVPVTWNETKAISGEIGKYAVIARRSNSNWYVGAINGNSKQNVSINLDFLEEGKYQLTEIADGKTAGEVIKTEQIITKNSIISCEIKATGGLILILKKM